MLKDIVSEIKNRMPLEQYIQKYVPLKKNGIRWIGLCPFHQERSPSFTVNTLSGFFYCFGCHASGDIFSFAEKYHGMMFKDVLLMLAEEVSLAINDIKLHTATEPSDKHVLFAMYKTANAHFVNNMKTDSGKQCLAYFNDRGISQDNITAFSLGYSLPSWDAITNLLRRSGFSKEHIALSGLVHTKDSRFYDAFRDRYMFPIIAMGGAVIAFGGRIAPLDQNNQAKYINSPETPIYSKGKTFYGITQARKHIASERSIMITEGYFDVITLHQFGYTNAVAVLGTALTKEHAMTIASLASTVELVFDADTAGKKASFNATRLLLLEGITVSVLLLPQGEDVDSFLHTFGSTAFEDIRKQGIDGMDFCIQMIQSLSPKEYTLWTQDFIKEVQEPIIRSLYIKKLALGLGIDASAIYEDKKISPIIQQKSTTTQKHHFMLTLSQQEHTILKHLITYPHNINTIRDAGLDLVLHSQEAKEIVLALYDFHSDYDALFSTLNDTIKPIFAKLRVEAEPTDKESDELQDILIYLEREYKKRNTAGATMLIKDLNDIEGLLRIQNIVRSHTIHTER